MEPLFIQFISENNEYGSNKYVYDNQVAVQHL